MEILHRQTGVHFVCAPQTAAQAALALEAGMNRLFAKPAAQQVEEPGTEILHRQTGLCRRWMFPLTCS